MEGKEKEVGNMGDNGEEGKERGSIGPGRGGWAREASSVDGGGPCSLRVPKSKRKKKKEKEKEKKKREKERRLVL